MNEPDNPSLQFRPNPFNGDVDSIQIFDSLASDLFKLLDLSSFSFMDSQANQAFSDQYSKAVLLIKNAAEQQFLFNSLQQESADLALKQADAIRLFMERSSETGELVTDFFENTFSTLFDFIRENVKSSLSELFKLNGVFTRIQETGILNSKQMASLAKEAPKTAGSYQISTADYLAQVLSLADKGFPDPKQQADLSLAVEQVTHLDPADTRQYLDAADAAYQYGGSVESLSDLLSSQNQMAKKSSLSIQELTKAFSTAAGLLYSSSIPSEEALTALLGAGMKTSGLSGEDTAQAISAFLADLRKLQDPAGYGKGLPGTEALTAMENRLKSLDIPIKSVHNGMVSLRDPLNILKELSKAYLSLESGKEKESLLADLGGGKTAAVFGPLLSQFDEYERMLDHYRDFPVSIFDDSARSATSWEQSLQSLSNTWDDFVGGFTDSSLINGGLQFLEHAVSLADRFVSFVTPLPALLGAIAAAASIKKGVGKQIR